MLQSILSRQKKCDLRLTGVQFCPFNITAQLFCNALNERGASWGPREKENFENLFSEYGIF